ncbi:methyl-accepting chemotaxis protein [Paenibacillus sp. NEAU-GSW1]|uniref:methyl-accepting chemotaxis protein n=1 Tax=Paenibacillus sp. NEAU-GSW1 TaxID=2682486 RepID=UPI0012E22E1B|nr:methyl-accepting chemotaxis protein [Paenibacillus sp. NEAU-GSW1]MUT65402.1 HAMP domain-containing protein [Paenibacillus sp. NEAU-GSW1]
MVKLNARNNRQRSIGTKLFLITFIGIVLLVSVLGVVSYSLSKQIIKDEVSQAQQQTLGMAADKMDATLSSFTGLTRQMLIDKELQAQFNNINSSSTGTYEKVAMETNIRGKLDSVRASNPSIGSLRLIPKSLNKSRIISSSGASSADMNDAIKADLEQVLKADGEVVFIATKAKGLFGFASEPSFAVARLLKNMKQRDSEYIIIMEFPVKLLSETFSKLNFGEGGSMTILTADEKVVYSSDAALEIGAAGPAHTSGQLVVRQPSAVTGWTLEGTSLTKQLLTRTNTILILTFAMCGLAAFVAVLIGYYLVRLVARPLAVIFGLMKEAENGNLTVRAANKGNDEIARLGGSFNRMMQQIGSLVNETNDSARQVTDRAERLIEVSRTMRHSSQHIDDATGQIANGAMQLAHEAEKGMESVDTIRNTMEEVASTNEGLNVSSDRFQSASREAATQMVTLVGLTDETAQKSHQLLTRIHQLKNSTASIRKLLDVMNAIARQTNILSLNASIEAARSGAAGKGFMVVAEEIRQLAEQSKQSIVTVSDMTNQIEQEMEATIAELQSVAPLLQEQSSAVNTAASTFSHMENQMNQVMQEISSSTSSIHQLGEMQKFLVLTISNVSAVSEQSAAASMEVASLTKEQLSISGELYELSKQLESLSANLHGQLMKFTT